jgi:MFS family permease
VERKWWTLLAGCIAIFMLLLDVTIVNVALPSIERDLGADFSDLQWVIDAYALTLAGFVLAAGSLADKVGRRLVFMLGLAIFTASSLACGLAPDPLFLNVSRAARSERASISPSSTERDELTITRAPSPANRSATARPIPLDDPVTTTTSLTPADPTAGCHGHSRGRDSAFPVAR